MARAATTEELALLRGENQRSDLYLAIHQPAAVLACQVNQSFDSTDGVAAVAYDNATGDYTDVLPGMTLWVGSAPGLDDLGRCRVRLAPTDTTLYIGLTSEIAWEDDLYLSVVDEFDLWPRHMSQDGNVARMDYDIDYSDQHLYFDPVPVLGPHAVLWLTGASVNLEMDAGESWVLESTIASYAWSAPGASAIAGANTAAPTITYATPGQYRVSCTVTSAAGKSAAGHRLVFVFSTSAMPARARLESCIHDYADGGDVYTVIAYDGVSASDVHDRAVCILFAVDYYGSAQTSIGPLPGRENILSAGRIAGETIDWRPKRGEIKFTVRGPQHDFDQVPGFATAIKDSADTPENWLEIEGLTVRAGLWHFLHWRSTATAIMDILITADARLIPYTDAPAGSLWQQVDAIARGILAKAVCDPYGRLWIDIDAQYLPVADRSGIPTVMAIQKGDWGADDGIRIERRTPQAALLDISGENYDGAIQTQLLARAPGNLYGRYGLPEAIDGLWFEDQAQANQITGLLYAHLNNPYPTVVIPLKMNNRLVGIAPRQYVTLTIAAGDTPRGIAWNNKRLLPRRVTITQTKNGALLADLECEAETTGEGQPAGVTVVPPQPPQDNTYPDPGDGGLPLVPPPTTWFPPVIGNNPYGDCKDDPNAPYNQQSVVFSPSVILAGETAYCYYPCGIRLDGATYPTHIDILGAFGDDAISYFSLVAIDSEKNTVLSPTSLVAIQNGIRATFEPVSGTSIAGFALSVEAGGNYLFIPGDEISSGTIDANIESGALVASGLTTGDWYCADATGGPWHPGATTTSFDIAASVNDGASWGSPYGEALGATPPGAINGYNRTIMQISASGTFRVRANDTTGSFGDNTGTIGYIFRPITATAARRISIGVAHLYNICAP